MSILKDITKYKKATDIAIREGKKIAQKLLDIIKKYKSISYSFGHSNEGVCTICFWNDSHPKYFVEGALLKATITEIFPELENYINCPSFGICIKKEDVENLKKDLLKLRRKND